MTPDDLKRWREDRGLTQQQLADALGMSSGVTVYRWETGRRPVPAWVPLALRGIEADE